LAENFITFYSNGFKDARHTGILTPMSPIFDQEPGTLNGGNLCIQEHPPLSIGDYGNPPSKRDNIGDVQIH
jgi:hypothetical protein